MISHAGSLRGAKYSLSASSGSKNRRLLVPRTISTDGYWKQKQIFRNGPVNDCQEIRAFARKGFTVTDKETTWLRARLEQGCMILSPAGAS